MILVVIAMHAVAADEEEVIQAAATRVCREMCKVQDADALALRIVRCANKDRRILAGFIAIEYKHLGVQHQNPMQHAHHAFLVQALVNHDLQLKERMISDPTPIAIPPYFRAIVPAHGGVILQTSEPHVEG